MILGLALIPAVILMVFIYKKDKREKEPIKLLWKCFLFGVISTIPAVAAGVLGEEVVECFIETDTFLYILIDNFILTALAEEGFKYVMLKSRTWRAPQFNCKFDGVVYAVYVSLGFAAFENILYCIDGGVSDAVLRMFTSVPSHACDAVYMGYFYSQAKQASLLENKKAERKNKRLALWIPVLLHGIYDCLICMDEEIVGEAVSIISILLWFGFVIATFVISFVIVNILSKTDADFAVGDGDDMGLFKSVYEKELDAIIQRIEVNMQNNYKDNAQVAFSEYQTKLNELIVTGKLKEKSLLHYEGLLKEYELKLQGYTHKDQKPYWT